MITINKVFKDAQEMDKFISDYFQEFHPAGYGTQIDEFIVMPIYDEGKFQYINYDVTISRSESCD